MPTGITWTGITPHLLAVYRHLALTQRWLTNAEITAALPDVAARTVRAHTRRLTDVGVLECAELFPEWRFRLAQHPSPAAAELVTRLEQAMAMHRGTEAGR